MNAELNIHNTINENNYYMTFPVGSMPGILKDLGLQCFKMSNKNQLIQELFLDPKKRMLLKEIFKKFHLIGS